MLSKKKKIKNWYYKKIRSLNDINLIILSYISFITIKIGVSENVKLQIVLAVSNNKKILFFMMANKVDDDGNYIILIIVNLLFIISIQLSNKVIKMIRNFDN